MGTGRSGTTILEILLRQSKGVFGLGELTYIFRDGWILNKPCSCGETAKTCKFWSQVMEYLKLDHESVECYERLFRKYERHSYFPFLLFMNKQDNLWHKYAAGNLSLFDSASKLSGANWIIDSSKYPGRALALSSILKERLRIICISRSADGLVNAFSKQNEGEQKPKPRSMAVAYFLYSLLCMWLVKRRLRENVLTIRFETLRNNPASALSAIEAWAGVDLADSLNKVSTGGFMNVGHIVTGNRIRKDGKVRFERREGVEKIKNSLIYRGLEQFRRGLGF